MTATSHDNLECDQTLLRQYKWNIFMRGNKLINLWLVNIRISFWNSENPNEVLELKEDIQSEY